MSDIAISVENLSKAYRIGLNDDRPDTLVESMFSWFKAPVKNFKKLRKLTSFDLEREEQDVIWALKDVSFEVKRGEVVGIIGRNGAGKSTLLKILSRITEPTSGRAVVYGRVGSLLEVGTGFHPELTGRENIYMNGTILGMTKKEIDQKFDEIVEFSGIEKFLDTPVKRYSSGMTVRLAFAVAAHLDPEILIVDEVLAVGDAEFQKKCLGKMESISKAEGKTVLFVSHNMGAVNNLCSRAIVMNQGLLAFDGNVNEAINFYSTFITKKTQLGYAERSNLAKDCYIKSVRLVDEEFKVKSVFKYNDRLGVIVTLNRINFKFCFTLLIKNRFGDSVYHIRSQDYGYFIEPKDNSSEIKILIDLPYLGLVENSYYVTLWLGNAFDEEIEVWHNCVSFNVTKSGSYAGRLSSEVIPITKWDAKGGVLVSI